MFHGINLTLDESAPAISESPQPPAKRMRPNPPAGGAFGGSGSAFGGGEPTAAGGEEAPPKCKCGILAKRCVAGPNAKPENRGRAFWACPRPKDLKCGFFLFEDGGQTPRPSYASAASAASAAVSHHGSTVQAPLVPSGRMWCPPPSASPFSALPASKQDAIRLLNLFLTPEEALEIRCAEQRSDAWLAARNHRVTMSILGSITGHNKYQTVGALLKERLWGGFKGNAATRRGTFFETEACKAYELVEIKKWGERFNQMDGVGMPEEMPFYVEHTGLVIDPDVPYVGVSPDGIAHNVLDRNMQPMTILLEIKCPASPLPYAQQPAYQTELFKGIPVGIPPQYWVQIQGQMHFLGAKECDFLVYTNPGKENAAAHITRYAYDPAFAKDVMLPAIDHFFFDMYVPAYLLKQAGKLEEGEIEESFHV